MNRAAKQIIKLEPGWNRIKNGGFETFLDRVEACDGNVLASKPNPVDEMVEIIDIVFQMCIQREPHNYSEQVYTRVQDRTKQYFHELHNTALEREKDKSDLDFLREMAKRWKQCTYTVHGIKRMFNYLNRYHVPNSDGLLDLVQNGYKIWREEVFDTYHTAMRDGILAAIRREREQELVNRDLLTNNIHIFVGLGQELKQEYANNQLKIYEDNFEKAFIEQTKQFYHLKSEDWRNVKSTPEYLIAVQTVQADEMSRLRSYLHSSTESRLMHTLRRVLLKEPQANLLDKDSGLIRMLEEKASDDLERLYSLYLHVEDGIAPIAMKFKAYIEKLGKGYIREAKEQDQQKETKKSLDLIKKIIQLHERFHRHVVEDFASHKDLLRALKDAFESFINDTNYVVKYLAKYAHQFMIKGGPSEGMSPSQKDEEMQQIRMIYGYIRDKDVFEREYQWYLSQRLLGNTSSSDEMEQKMIGLLKKECGYHWAQKLEDMFKDMQTSKELMREFKKNNREVVSYDLDVNICEYGKWPENVDQKKLAAIRPPGPLETITARLKSFYEEKHSGRKFFIRWDKGSAECLVTFNKKTKTERILIFKNLYQVMVMLLFNGKNAKGKPIFKYSEISQKLQIPDPELQAALLPLYNPKLKVLQKKPNKRDIEPDHAFRLNSKFNKTNMRIVVPTYKVQTRDANEEEVPAPVLQQRKHQMDAAVVRIMKARRQFSCQELLGEVIQQLNARFRPDPKQIKKRIEALIAQDYLERDEDDRQQLIYKQ